MDNNYRGWFQGFCHVICRKLIVEYKYNIRCDINIKVGMRKNI